MSDEQLNELTDWIKSLSERVLALELAAIRAGGDSDVARQRKGHERYETVRRLTPRQFSDMWRVSIRSDKPFDDLVDEMMPVMSGKNQCSEETK